MEQNTTFSTSTSSSTSSSTSNSTSNSTSSSTSHINTELKINFENSYQKIIKTFPIYHNIFKQYFENGKDVSWELNRLYKPIFIGMMENYENFMDEQTIYNIINDINSKFNPEKSFTIIDYLEYLYGNIYYETFLSEIKKLNQNDIRYEHLCVFEYIIKVECIKYTQYVDTIEKIKSDNSESKLLVAMDFRINNCLKKISFCISWIERNYSMHNDFIGLCKDIIEEKQLSSLINLELINKVNKLDSFMNWNKS